MFALRGRIRFSALMCAAVLFLGLAFAQVPSPNGFDNPLYPITGLPGGNLRVAMAGVGTAEGAGSFTVDIPGTPVAAWVYWSGESRANVPGQGDSTIGLGVDPSGFNQNVAGVESGRRSYLFTDELVGYCATNGGEVVYKATVPASAFLTGMNSVNVSQFNEGAEDGPACEGSIAQLRKQYGITLVVLYTPSDPSAAPATLLALEGADVANYQRYARETFEHPEQARGDITCFDFASLGCTRSARISIGVAGAIHFDPDPALGKFGSPERTFFRSGSGPKPVDPLVADAEAILLEDNDLRTPPYHRGELIAVLTGTGNEVTLQQGDTWACFQHELYAPEPAPTGSGFQIPQNFVTHVATLEIEDNSCAEPACLVRSAGWWGKRPGIVAQYVPATSCGLRLNSADGHVAGSASEDLCYDEHEARHAQTSPQFLNLVQECAAAELNFAASLAGGGDCAAERPHVAALIASCCDDLCASAPEADVIKNSKCVKDLHAFNKSESTLDPFGPFVRPGRGDKDFCEWLGDNHYVNRTDAFGGARVLGPPRRSGCVESQEQTVATRESVRE